MSKTWQALPIIVFGLSSTYTEAASLVPSAVLSVQSEPIYRGISESLNNSAAAINIDLSLSSNWLAGIGASSALSSGTQQRDRSITSHISYNRELGDRVVLGGAIVHRAFPGSIKEWDFTEIQSSIRWDNSFAFTIAYSDNYYDHQTTALSTSLDWFRPLSARSYLTATVGSTYFDNTVISQYTYSNIGLGWRSGPITAELSYGYTSRNNTILFGEPIKSPELQLNLTYFAW
ncbi:MAG: hypothetical protein AB8B86_12265 [Pseudomonadales bacterium]